MRIVLLLLLLSACTKLDEGAKNVQWVQLEDIKTECSDSTFEIAGCYKWRGDTCYIFTKKPANETDKAVHMAMGHELRHCFQGDFHAALSY